MPFVILRFVWWVLASSLKGLCISLKFLCSWTFLRGAESEDMAIVCKSTISHAMGRRLRKKYIDPYGLIRHEIIFAFPSQFLTRALSGFAHWCSSWPSLLATFSKVITMLTTMVAWSLPTWGWMLDALALLLASLAVAWLFSSCINTCRDAVKMAHNALANVNVWMWCLIFDTRPSWEPIGARAM